MIGSTRAPLKCCFTVKTRYTPTGALQPVKELPPLKWYYRERATCTPTGTLQPVKELL